MESAAVVIVPYSYAGAVLSLLGQEPGSFSSWQFKPMMVPCFLITKNAITRVLYILYFSLL